MIRPEIPLNCSRRPNESPVQDAFKMSESRTHAAIEAAARNSYGQLVA